MTDIITRDLGFSYQKRQDEYHIYHHGRKACVLRGAKAARFHAALASPETSDLQQLMARLTGNYKRGNERHAKHLRNRS